jgi:hypothetical protein
LIYGHIIIKDYQLCQRQSDLRMSDNLHFDYRDFFSFFHFNMIN